MAHSIKIDDPQGLSIAREFREIHKGAHEFRKALEQELDSRWKEKLEEVNRELNENLERLRLHLGVTTFGPDKPEVVMDYYDHGVVFLKLKTTEAPKAVQ